MPFQIKSTPALIGIRTTPGKLNIRQKKADMELNIQHPKLEIRTQKPKIKIDQSAAWAERGLKNFLDLSRETAQLAKQAAAQGIERVVRQGNELAAIENETDPIPIQAEENAFELFKVDYNLGTMPKSGPDIQLIRGKVDTELHRGKVNLQVKVNKPEINYTRGKVDIYLRQKNSIDIRYVGDSFDKKV